MSATDTAALRKRSKDAFGQEYQLEVMLTVADAAGVVNQKGVAEQLDLSQTNVQTVWKRLVTLDLLKFEYRDLQHYKYYARNEQTLAWNYARELAGELWEH